MYPELAKMPRRDCGGIFSLAALAPGPGITMATIRSRSGTMATETYPGSLGCSETENTNG